MSNVLDNIKARRSIRSFKDAPIEKKALETIVEAAVWAPTASNRQGFHFYVLEGREKISQLTDVIGAALGQENYDAYAPTAYIIAANDRENPHGYADCSCALQNMLLMAYDLGIGAVWSNQLKETCDVPEVRTLLTSYGVPENYVVWGCAALGHTDNLNPVPPERKAVVKYVE